MLYLETRDVEQPGLCRLASSAVQQCCVATQQSQEGQRFSVSHTAHVLQDQHLLEAPGLSWRCCAAVCVMGQHLPAVVLC